MNLTESERQGAARALVENFERLVWRRYLPDKPVIVATSRLLDEDALIFWSPVQEAYILNVCPGGPGQTDEELFWILLHEVGHAKLGHLPWHGATNWQLAHEQKEEQANAFAWRELSDWYKLWAES